MYIAVSDMLLTYIKSCWAIVYDHVYAENYGITGVYDLVKNGDGGLPVPDYTDENVSGKVVRIIQSYTGVVDKMVWRKDGGA